MHRCLERGFTLRGVAATEYSTDFEQGMTRFDGKQCTKIEMLNFVVAHEMYHRGQLTVYERLLGIEPALTQFFRKMMSASS
ncbi:MAG TPA: DinB family protein [Blastocatellia bacterium]|nr:DinB family protein [Blastocatellia bacterium]